MNVLSTYLAIYDFRTLFAHSIHVSVGVATSNLASRSEKDIVAFTFSALVHLIPRANSAPSVAFIAFSPRLI